MAHRTIPSSGLQINVVISHFSTQLSVIDREDDAGSAWSRGRGVESKLAGTGPEGSRPGQCVTRNCV